MPCAWAKARASTLSPNSVSVAGEGPMKRRPSAWQRCAKSGVLRQEAVARMDAVAAAVLGRGDDGVDVEIAAHRVAADTDRCALPASLVCSDSESAGVKTATEVDAERRGRPGDADRDLAAIGDQDALEHCFISPQCSSCTSGFQPAH